MSDLTDVRYDCWRQQIMTFRTDGLSWDEIVRNGEAEFINFCIKTLRWPAISSSDWNEMVRKAEDNEKTAIESETASLAAQDDASIGADISGDVKLATSPGSSWCLYKSHLLAGGWHEGAVTSIGNSALSILKKMSRETARRPEGAIKGLVVGHVQSGKTASMAALMAVGADNLYNFFIILSGTIESLRKQTSARLYNDLKSGNLHWNQLAQLGSNPEYSHKLSNLKLGSNNIERYFTVSLKNKSRLEKLLQWLRSDPNLLAQMRLVIIDDEADQASINVGGDRDDRMAINNCITEITQVKAKAVNYIAYTATPYSCFLNEAFPESLYPKDFIRSLPQSSEHFGPGQIFGADGYANGLEIIREITQSDVGIINNLHGEASIELPESFKNAIAWFLCAAATMRVYGIKKPVSMLVHTSQKQDHHDNVAKAIKKWLMGNQKNILKHSEDIWNDETSSFTMRDFQVQFPEYRLKDKLTDYPPFKELKKHIVNLLSRVSNIPLDEDDAPEYHEGIHLCIDNCRNNGVVDNEIVRLVYPDYSNQQTRDNILTAPAFIVVGGSTLSRGLTIEGLVCTYFLRNTIQADTLMQMGRWFGYRRGYELLPRIWMPKTVREKFEYLVLLEKELREELRSYQNDQINPAQFGPRVKNSPKPSWMLPTAKSRMSHAISTQLDYSGRSPQTTLFLSEKAADNLVNTESFLISLEQHCDRNELIAGSRVWRGVEFSVIEKYLDRMHFHPSSTVFSDLKPFYEWYHSVEEDACYGKWNVVLAGIRSREFECWKPFGVNNISRTVRKRSSNDDYHIKIMRGPRDLVADISPKPPNLPKNATNTQIQKARESGGLALVPQLLLYRIRGIKDTPDSVVPPTDLIGVSIWIPGARATRGKVYGKTLQVRIPEVDIIEE